MVLNSVKFNSHYPIRPIPCKEHPSLDVTRFFNYSRSNYSHEFVVEIRLYKPFKNVNIQPKAHKFNDIKRHK